MSINYCVQTRMLHDSRSQMHNLHLFHETTSCCGSIYLLSGMSEEGKRKRSAFWLTPHIALDCRVHLFRDTNLCSIFLAKLVLQVSPLPTLEAAHEIRGWKCQDFPHLALSLLKFLKCTMTKPVGQDIPDHDSDMFLYVHFLPDASSR